MQSDKVAAGPDGWPFIGSMLEARRDPLAFTERLAREYGDVARFHLGIFKGYLVSHPDGVRYVLQDNHPNYDKRNYDYEMLRPFVGDGLITSNGDPWLRERRLIQPTFHQDHLAKFATAMNPAIQSRLETWRPLAERGRVVDVAREMNELALEIVSKTLFGAELGPRKDRILDAFQVLNHEVARRFKSLLVLPLWLPLPRNLKARRAKDQLDQVLMDFLAEFEGRNPAGSLLGRLLEAHGGITEGEAQNQMVRDEMVTLILAGHETTGSLLSWTWYLLAQHPEAASQVREEARRILSGREPQAADLEDLVFLEAVLKEALRLYPPVWIISRRAKGDDQILGYRIPAGSVVALSPYVVHRDPTRWDDPDRFNPKRFLSGGETERKPFAYFPFGGGPRLCIGGGFSMMEAKMVVASVVQNFQLELTGESAVQPEALITLRPRNGLKMRLRSA